MEEKTTRLLIAGAIIIVLAGGIFGGWFKTAAEMIGRTPVKAATVCKANGASYDEGFMLSGMKCVNGQWLQVSSTTTQPQAPTATTTPKEVDTPPQGKANEAENTTSENQETKKPTQTPIAIEETKRLERQRYLEYKGYKFKLDHVIYENDEKLYGILMDVIGPDGTESYIEVSKIASATVGGSIEISFEGVYPEDKSWVTVKIRDNQEN